MKTSKDFTPQHMCSEYEHMGSHINLEDNEAIANKVIKDYCVNSLTGKKSSVPIEQQLEVMLMKQGYIWLTDKQRNSELWSLRKRVERYLMSETRPITSLTKSERILPASENVFGEDVEVLADYLVVSDDKQYVNVISVRGEEARLDQNELASEWGTYFLCQLGHFLYPNAIVTAEINYLRDATPGIEAKLLNENFFNPVSGRSEKTTRLPMSASVRQYFEEKRNFELEHVSKCHDCSSCSNAAKCNYERPLMVTEAIRELNANNVPLTIQQRQAATTHDIRPLIKAKAGSGKTTVTALNCLDAIKKGERPENILMVSYTVNGAQEIVNRVQSFLNGTPLTQEELAIQRRLGTDIQDTSTLQVNAQEIIHGTFNSFCQSLITERFEELGYEKPPVVLTDDKRLELINLLIDKYPKLPGVKYKNRTSVLSKKKSNPISEDDALALVSTLFANVKKHNLLEEDKETVLEAEISKLYENKREKSGEPMSQRSLFLATEYLTVMFEEYEHLLKEHCLIEFADHPYLVCQLHDKDPYLFNDLHYIYVDEFQDTTEAFLNLLNRMCDHTYIDPLTEKECPPKLFCVGDDKQALFRFANATDRGILNFESIYGQSTIIDIQENFRCSKTAIDFVNQLNDEMKNRFGTQAAEPLIATAAPGDPIVVKSYNTRQDEYKDIARMVEQDVKNGIPLSEIYIQASTRRELLAIGSELAKRKLPVVTKCSVSIIENSNVQAAVNFLRASIVIPTKKQLENDLLSYEFVRQQNQTPHTLSFADVEEDAKTLQHSLKEQKITPELVMEYLNALDPNGEDECYQEFLQDYSACHSLQAMKEALTTFISFGKGRTFKRDGDYEAIVLGTPWAIKGLEGQSVYVCMDGYDDVSFYKIKKREAIKTEIKDKANLAYTACTRIAGTKEYEGEDGKKHRGTLHVTGVRFFATDHKTGQRYENRFLNAAFSAIGKHFTRQASEIEDDQQKEFPNFAEWVAEKQAINNPMHRRPTRR